MKRAKIVPISIDPDRLMRLDKLKELAGRSRSGFLSYLVDREWERYILTDAGRKALLEARKQEEQK